MTKRTYILAPVSDADGICASQTPAAGGVQSLSINGALASDGAVELSNAHIIRITSAGNDSGRTFTVTGLDESSQPQTETVTGANAGTAVTVGYYSKVTSITVDANTASSLTVGVNGVCTSKIFVCDSHNFTGLAVGVVVESGTLTYSVQHTMDDIQDANASITWTSHTSVTGTATADGSYDVCPVAVRAIISAFTSGSARFNVVQSGVR